MERIFNFLDNAVNALTSAVFGIQRRLEKVVDAVARHEPSPLAALSFPAGIVATVVAFYCWLGVTFLAIFLWGVIFACALLAVPVLIQGLLLLALVACKSARSLVKGLASVYVAIVTLD